MKSVGKVDFFFPDYLLLKVKKPWSDLLILPCNLITGLLIVLRLRYNLSVLCMSGRKEYGGTGSHQYNQSRKYLVNFVLILIDGNCTQKILCYLRYFLERMKQNIKFSQIWHLNINMYNADLRKTAKYVLLIFYNNLQQRYDGKCCFSIPKAQEIKALLFVKNLF